MITTGNPMLEPMIYFAFYISIFLGFLSCFLIICIRYLVNEVDRLYVKIELFRRGHIDHTKDDIDRFIEEYRKRRNQNDHKK